MINHCSRTTRHPRVLRLLLAFLVLLATVQTGSAQTSAKVADGLGSDWPFNAIARDSADNVYGFWRKSSSTTATYNLIKFNPGTSSWQNLSSFTPAQAGFLGANDGASLAIDGAGGFHVAVSGSNGNGVGSERGVWYAYSANGTTWSTFTKVETYSDPNGWKNIYYPSIRVDGNNRPHIVFEFDDANGNRTYKIRYRWYNGSSWQGAGAAGDVYVQAGNASNDVSYPSFAVDSNGKAHIFFQAETNGSGLDGSLYYVNNVSGSYSAAVNVHAGSTGAQVGGNASVVVDPANKLHLTYSNQAKQIFYANNVSGSWVKNQINGNLTGYPTDNCFSRNSSGDLALIYGDSSNPNVMVKYARLVGGVGSTWQTGTLYTAAVDGVNHFTGIITNSTRLVALFDAAPAGGAPPRNLWYVTQQLTSGTTTAPTVTTPTSTSVTTTTATLGGNVTANGGATITERGVVFAPTSVNNNPMVGGANVTKVTASGTTGVFTVNASSLSPGTGYTYKAYATNSVGTGYTSTGTFTTASPPNLSINDVSQSEGNAGTTTFTFTVSLNTTSATAVTFNIGTSDGTATVADGDYVARSLTNQSIPAGSTTYSFAVTVNGDTTVEPNQNFFVNVSNISGATGVDTQGQGTIVNDDVLAPTVTTPTHTAITATTATLGGNVTNDGGGTITERGVVFAPTATNNNPQINGTGVTKVTAGGTTGVFTANAASLTRATGYSYAAYATNSAGTTYTAVTTFTTLAVSPTVTSPTSANVLSTTATLGGNVTNDGGSAITERGVVYSFTSQNTNPLPGGSLVTKVIGTGTTGVFTVNATGLAPGASYTYRAYAINNLGTSVSATGTFTTPATPPTVSAPTVTNITATGATLGGNASSTGGASITERGVVYARTSINSDPFIGGTGVTKVTTPGTTGAFSVGATSLTAGTGYSFKAYATNSAGTTYTTPVSTFTTTAVVPTVTTPTSTGITATAATLGGNVTGDGGSTIIERGVVYSATSTNNNPQINGTGVTKIVGTGTTGVFTVSASALTVGTGYSFRAYATNSIGTTYTTPVSTFTTSFTAPVVTTPTSTNIAATTATLGGNVTSAGGSTITERGIVCAQTTLNGDPTIGGSGVLKIATTGTTGVFTVNVSSLTSNTGYTFKAYAMNNIGTTYTAISTFTTSPVAPTVINPNSSSITATSAILSANVTSDGGSAITERGLVYSVTATNNNPQIGGTGVTKVAVNGTLNLYNSNVTSLTPNTGYSFKAYATNNVGTTYTSPVSTFTTNATTPTVNTPTATTITATTASLGGTVASDGGSAITERGVVYSATAANNNPTMGGTGVFKLTTTGTLGGFTVGTSNLTPGTSYSFKAYAANTLGTTYTSPVSTFTTGAATPTVTAPTSADLTATTATLGGNVTSDNGAPITERGVVYSITTTNNTQQIGGTGVTKVTATGTTGVFTISASSLTGGTPYSFRAYATNSIGTTYTTPVSTFTSSAVAPLVTAPTHTSVTASSATLGGNVTGTGGSPITERGVVYAPTTTNSDPTIGGTGVIKASTTGTTGVFTVGVASLSSNTGYSYKAYATNNVGTTYTAVSSFTSSPVVPTVNSPTSASVTTSTATLGGNVSSDGGSAIIERGVVYSATATNSNPNIGGTGVTKITATGTTGVFTANISSLSANTGYSFKAYATNSIGTTYTSPVSTFNTAALAPTVTTPTSASITASAATLGGNVTSDGGAAIQERGVVYSPTGTNNNPTIGGTGVIKATATGTTGVFTVNVSSLTAGTGYSFKAYATNSTGTTYTTPVSTFNTSAVVPTVTTPTHTGVTINSATLGGNVTGDGGSAIIERGVVYAPTTTNNNPLIGGTGVVKVTASGTTGVFTANASSLTAGVNYTYKAYATNNIGTAYTSTGSFLTTSLPNLSINDVSQLEGNTGTTTFTFTVSLSAPSTGNVVFDIATADGSANVANADYVPRSLTEQTIPAGSTIYNFAVTVNGDTAIEPNQTFFVNVTNVVGANVLDGQAQGTIVNDDVAVAPTVTTPTHTGITATAATLGGTVSSDGGAAITERGVVYARATTNENPQIGGPGVTKLTATGTTGVFTANASSLTPATGYNYAAYATNSVGTTYTAVTTFSTAAALPTVTTPTSTNVQATTATLGGNVTSNGGAAITERGVVYSITTANNNPMIGGTGVTKIIGTGTTGIFTVNATALDDLTGYSFKAYATNTTGTSYTPVATFSTAADATTIESLNRANANPTNAATVNWTLTFNAPVTGLTATNFQLEGSLIGATVGTPTTGNGGLTWNIPANTGTGNGPLTLLLVNATNFSRPISTGLPFTGQTYDLDRQTEVPTLIAPAANSASKSPVSVQFTLPENAQAGSVRLTFAGGASTTLTLAGSQETAGAHAFTFDPANPTAQVAIASGGALAEGVYSVTLEYRDALGNAVTSAANANFRLDTVAPTLNLPANLTVEATGPTGAVVIYTANASDAGSGVATSNFTPASGSVFAIATTTVNASAADQAGNTATGSFTVTVRDTTAPAISTPASPLTVSATSGTGAVVNFAVSATDLVDGVVATTLDHASGDTYPIGDTTVVVSAQDSRSNVSSTSFVIRVTALPNGVGAKDDVVTLTGSDARAYPMANDNFGTETGFTLVSVSDPTIVIDGRSILVPADYTGTGFDYTVSNGPLILSAHVTVVSAPGLTDPRRFGGLLYDEHGEIVGWARMSRSARGLNTFSASIGTARGRATFSFPAGTLAKTGVATDLGPVDFEIDEENRLNLTFPNGVTGRLRPSRTTGTAASFNFALAHAENTPWTGGYGTLRVRPNGDVIVSFRLPDGKTSRPNAMLADNGSLTFYGEEMRTNPKVFIGGELILADLASTDLTGEVTVIRPTPAGGTPPPRELLVVNGSRFSAANGVPNGPVTVTLAGATFPTPVVISTTSNNSVVAGSGALKSWAAKAGSGVFRAQIVLPGTTRPVTGNGVFLPKTGSAWGYFPGAPNGGRIELVPTGL